MRETFGGGRPKRVVLNFGGAKGAASEDAAECGQAQGTGKTGGGGGEVEGSDKQGVCGVDREGSVHQGGSHWQ